MRLGRVVAQHLLDEAVRSTNSDQSIVESSRMLVITLPTDTWLAACRWCSTRIISSPVALCPASRCSSQMSTGAIPGPWSRSRWRSCTAKGGLSSPRALALGEEHEDLGRLPLGRLEQPIGPGVGPLPLGARPERLPGQPPQILDQRQPKHDRHRPELADRQRRGELVGEREAPERLGVEPTVAVRDHVDRDRVDARVAGVSAPRELRQLALVVAR